jgi:glycosyltransferase involved in cell wall biosynthesis
MTTPTNASAELRSLRIVFASHTFIGGPFVVGSHHLAREMARLGHTVVHLSTPVTPLHLLAAEKRDATTKRLGIWRRNGQICDGMFLQYVPLGLLPWGLAGPAFRCVGVNLATITLPRLSVYLRRRGLSEIDILFVDQPAFIGIERMLRVRASIMRATDLTASQGGLARRAAEIALAKSADGLVGTSKLVLDSLTEVAPMKPSALIENGVEAERFLRSQPQPSELRPLARPILIYAGAMDERFDHEAVIALARTRPDFNIVLIGPKPPQIASAPPKNIHLLGMRPYEQLAGYFQHADLGLLPLNDHPSNAGRSPMKLYEYAAAGLPVVARQMPEIARRGEPFVFCYEKSCDLAETCRAVLARPHDKDAIRALAIEHSWTVKARQLLSFATGLLDRKAEQFNSRTYTSA